MAMLSRPTRLLAANLICAVLLGLVTATQAASPHSQTVAARSLGFMQYGAALLSVLLAAAAGVVARYLLNQAHKNQR